MECNDLSIASLPYLTAWIPLPTCLFDPLTQVDLGAADTQIDARVRLPLRYGWFPGTRCDHKCYRLEALRVLGIIPRAHADETVTILYE